MSLIIQKYGGTSVATTEQIRSVATRVVDARRRGHQVVVVVSAMRGVTDGLIKLAREITPLPSEREMDMLLATGEQTTIALTAMALHALGVPAVSLTGAQAGIVTDGVHTKAKIQNITLNPSKISGVCGRLMCCLVYEHETYRKLKKNLPRRGSRVSTPLGAGTIFKQNIMEQKVTVHLESGESAVVDIEDLTKAQEGQEEKKPPAGPKGKPVRQKHSRQRNERQKNERPKRNTPKKKNRES